MKIDLTGNVTLNQIESVLARTSSTDIIKITKKSDCIKVASNPLKGAVVTIKASDNFSQVKVTPQMPIALAMTIILVIATVMIHQAIGVAYGKLDGWIFIRYAGAIAIFGPVLLSHIVSRPFAKRCVDIISRGLQGVQLNHIDENYGEDDGLLWCCPSGTCRTLNIFKADEATQQCSKCLDRYRIEGILERGLIKPKAEILPKTAQVVDAEKDKDNVAEAKREIMSRAKRGTEQDDEHPPITESHVNLNTSKKPHHNAKNRRQAFIEAVHEGLLTEVKAYLEIGIDVNDVNIRSSMGQTPLMFAARKGHPEIVRILIEHGADSQARDKHNKTALSYAFISANEEIENILIERNVDFDFENLFPYLGNPRAIAACIDRGADIEGVNENTGLTALHQAVYNSQYETLKLLIDEGADVNARERDVRDSKGSLTMMRHNNTALHQAATYTSPEMTQILIAGEADVNARSSGGFTPLMVAAERGKTEVVEELIIASADITAMVEGKTALEMAKRMGFEETAHVISIKKQEELSIQDKGKDLVGKTRTIQPNAGANTFYDNRDGTVIETATRLQWQTNPDGVERNYDDAVEYVGKLDLGGHKDWRLPEKEELIGLTEVGYAHLQNVFSSWKAERYWANTKAVDLYWAEDPARIAYVVDFDPKSSNYGRAITYFRTYKYNVCAVRGG